MSGACLAVLQRCEVLWVALLGRCCWGSRWARCSGPSARTLEGCALIPLGVALPIAVTLDATPSDPSGPDNTGADGSTEGEDDEDDE